MAEAYSNDLRRQFFQAYDEGGGTLEETADQFRVSLGWAKKISARRTRSGESDAPEWRRGPVSRVTEATAEWMGEEIGRQPDITLRELGERLAECQQVRLGTAQIWRVVQRLGLPRKKNPTRPRARQ